MALVPSHQFYPRTTISTDSFRSSVSLQFFRYGSSSSFTKHKFCVTRSNSGSNSMPRRNPQTKSNFLLRKKNNKWNFACQASILESNCSLCLSSSSWLENWNKSSKQNKSKRPVTVLGCRNSGNISSSNREESSINTGGGSTMERIVEKLKKFGYVDDVDNKKEKEERVTEIGSIEDIFYVEEDLLPNSRTSLSEKSQLGNESVFKTAGVVRFPWEKPALKDEQKSSVREKSRFALAELTLPESELRRLKNLALRIKNKTRVGGSGVTKEILDRIHEKWNTSEVVRLKIEGPPALNMKRMHEILERKTGGLVIWRSGTSLALYRGVSYDKPSKQKKDLVHVKNEVHSIYPAATDKTSKGLTEQGPVDDMPTPTTPQSDTLIVDKGSKIAEPLPEVKYEEEVDRLLDGLGRRYTDWSGCDPLPVDADLLPGIVPGFQPPFRILPYGVRYTLRIKEATDLRRLAKVLPPHFALGRSRQHQGLAMAMIKLWEKSSIAKIALKRGVQLTASERMAEDIKRLTGGVLLSRTKDFLVFFRGKDFLTTEVANVLLEKEKLAKTFQEEEEQARLRASLFVSPSTEVIDESGTAGTLEETLDADAKWGKRLDDRDKENVMREAELVRHANLVRKLERKLAFAERKLLKAERALGKVEECLNPAERAADQDSISDEERFMFRKLGLRMKAFLLLGRRGVFGGTVENMHLHWKYRELVKIIVKSKYFEHVRKIALSLEAESGGILVSVDRVSKGYAIVVFRGKDYKRPPDLRPKNLLTKRKALARSIELQRREALLNHVSTLQARVERIRSEVEQMATFKERGNVKLYDQLDSAYPTEDEDSEMEGEEAYLESYESDGELKSGSFDPTQNFDLETTFIDDFQDELERDDKDHNALADFNAPYPRVDEIGEEVRLQQLN